MESCIHCTEKHLGRARGLYEEAKAGYPGRIGMTLGELSLAEEEAREQFPALSAQIRAQRKMLEAQRDYRVPFESLLKQAENAILTQRPQARKMAPGDCPGCGGSAPKGMASPQGALGVRSFRKATQARSQAPATLPTAPVSIDQAPDEAPDEAADEAPVTGAPDPVEETPLLVLLTAFNDFIASYSLVSVVLDQARAAVRAGFRVIVAGVEGFSPPDRYREDPYLRHVEFREAVPRVQWKEDTVDDEVVSELLSNLVPFLNSFDEAPIVLTHDLIFQSWYTSFAKALHLIDARLKRHPKWYHQMHSSVGERPPEKIARWRASVPEGHQLVVPNWSDVVNMHRYYQYEGKIHILPNIRDYRTFLGLTPRARYIADTFAPHLADVCQVYPLSVPRAEAKGLDRVIETFAALKQQGASVCLIVAEAHATGDGAKASQQMAQQAQEVGLVIGQEYIPTSRVFPSRVAYGLTPADIRGLMQLSNVFAFPSLSEACGLVMLEAAMCGALLVLNQSLHQVQDFMPPHAALWVDWGGSKQEGDPRREHVAQEVAAAILREVRGNRVLAARERVMRTFCLERLAKTMRTLWVAEVGNPAGDTASPGL